MDKYKGNIRMIEAERYVGKRMNGFKLVQYEFRLKIKRDFLNFRKVRFCALEPKVRLRPQQSTE